MRNSKVLIVDDSRFINNTIFKRLVKLGYDCESSFSLEDAISKFNNIEFDYIILDLNLPDSFGEELVDTIKKYSKAKIIVLTVETDSVLREALFDRGIFDFIVKDSQLMVSIENLHSSIQSLENNKKNSVLVIDDSKFIRKKVEKILKVRNYNVLTAEDAQKGLELLYANSINAIVLDMELPEINGLEFLREIKSKELFSNIPVIVLSGTNDAGFVRDSLKLGALDFIHKPFNIEEFVLKVDRAILSENTRRELEDIKISLEERVEAEVKNSKEKDRLMHAQARSAQMGEMINMIAHQWRQPLSAISATSSEISVRAKLHKLDEDVAGKLAKRISEYSQHLSITIDDFREFFKVSKEKRETNCDDIVNSVLNIVEISLVNQNIEIIKEMNCKEPFMSYPSELKQVVLNLVKNAEDILLDNKIEHPEIKIKTYSNDDKFTIEVSDNGGGVPDDIKSDIFQPYFSTKIEKNGTGLGLYMSKIIVEKHCGGKLELRNSDKGAVFSVVLKKKR